MSTGGGLRPGLRPAHGGEEEEDVNVRLTTDGLLGGSSNHKPLHVFTLSLRMPVTHLVIPSPLGSVPRPKAARRGMERPRVEEKGRE